MQLYAEKQRWYRLLKESMPARQAKQLVLDMCQINANPRYIALCISSVKFVADPACLQRRCSPLHVDCHGILPLNVTRFLASSVRGVLAISPQ